MKLGTPVPESPNIARVPIQRIDDYTKKRVPGQTQQSNEPDFPQLSIDISSIWHKGKPRIQCATWSTVKEADVGAVFQVFHLHRPCHHRRHVRCFVVLRSQGSGPSVCKSSGAPKETAQSNLGLPDCGDHPSSSLSSAATFYGQSPSSRSSTR